MKRRHLIQVCSLTAVALAAPLALAQSAPFKIGLVLPMTGQQASTGRQIEAAGVQTLWDCRRGECGLCAMDVLAIDGEIDHRDVFLSEHEKKSSQRICVCVSRAVGTLTIDSAYRPD